MRSLFRSTSRVMEKPKVNAAIFYLFLQHLHSFEQVRSDTVGQRHMFAR